MVEVELQFLCVVENRANYCVTMRKLLIGVDLWWIDPENILV